MVLMAEAQEKGWSPSMGPRRFEVGARHWMLLSSDAAA
jgi:hypothetical protein